MPFDPSKELRRLRSAGRQLTAYESCVVNLIASDNAYPRASADQPAYDGWMIQEGLLNDRPFAGARLHDLIETIASQAACRVFDTAHANVQPHSCSQANQAVYTGLLKPSDRVLALGFRAGGHLTHGLGTNFSGRTYAFSHYGLDERGLIDYSEVSALAQTVEPQLILCGSSSYPRLYDVETLRRIADSVGAYLMLDLSHEAGLIAGGALANPITSADVATMSLDKTLRGPFGGLILCRGSLAAQIDRGVHPGTQSSFSVRRLADAAHALLQTQTRAFRQYAASVLRNATALAEGLTKCGARLLTGGTDKHYVIVNTRDSYGLGGTDAEQRLERIGILTNRQVLPHDGSGRSATSSGLRLGTAWVTSRGYESRDIEALVYIIHAGLTTRPARHGALRGQIRDLVRASRPGDVWRS